MDRYRKVKRIGKGSFGTVFLCIDTQSENKEEGDQYVVVKEINVGGLSDKERRDAVNESKVLAHLIHPNIIRYHKSFEVFNHDFIISFFFSLFTCFSQLVFFFCPSCRKTGICIS